MEHKNCAKTGQKRWKNGFYSLVVVLFLLVYLFPTKNDVYAEFREREREEKVEREVNLLTEKEGFFLAWFGGSKR